jgi:septal ring factor EnvC (AmiA/AmiB activator)
MDTNPPSGTTPGKVMAKVNVKNLVKQRIELSKELAKEKREKQALLRDIEEWKNAMKAKDGEIRKLKVAGQIRETKIAAQDDRNKNTLGKLRKCALYADRLERVARYADSEEEKRASLVNSDEDGDIIKSYESYLRAERYMLGCSLHFFPVQDPIMTLKQYVEYEKGQADYRRREGGA